MVKEYATPVTQLLKRTTNNQEGMKRIVVSAEEAIKKVDQDIAELLIQRESLATIHEKYVALYEVIMGEELRSRREVREMEDIPEDAQAMNWARKIVIQTAEEAGKYVRESEIIGSLKRSGQLPWKNPRAVIATILLATGRWQKKEPGVYEMVEELQT